MNRPWRLRSLNMTTLLVESTATPFHVGKGSATLVTGAMLKPAGLTSTGLEAGLAAGAVPAPWLRAGAACHARSASIGATINAHNPIQNSLFAFIADLLQRSSRAQTTLMGPNHTLKSLFWIG